MDLNVDEGCPPEGCRGWTHIHLTLPYFEEGVIADGTDFNFTGGWLYFFRTLSASEKDRLCNTRVTGLLCPSLTLWEEHYGFGYRKDYYGCYGGKGHSEATGDPQSTPLVGSDGIVADDGVLYADSDTKFAEITDGSSKTLLAGESYFGTRYSAPGYNSNAGGPPAWFQGGSGKGGSKTSFARALRGSRHAINTEFICTLLGSPIPTECRLRSRENEVPFGSQHAGDGCNFVFSDGHVAFLTAGIDFDFYQGLSTRATGETLDSE